MVSFINRCLKDQRAFSLIELVIAIGILGLVATAFLAALSTSSKALFTADQRETAKNLAESQLEYVKDLDYATTYSPAPIPAQYPNYLASISTVNITSRDSDIQKINVTIRHQGRDVITLSGFKVK